MERQMQFYQLSELTNWLNDNITEKNTQEVLLLEGIKNNLSIKLHRTTLKIPDDFLNVLYKAETRRSTNKLLDFLPFSLN